MKAMGQITVVNNITLDGVMQAPARPDEDTRGGFTHGGWANPYQDEIIGKRMGEMMGAAKGSLLFGRTTYEDLYSYWPKQNDNPFTEHLNKIHKYVASATLKDPLPWENSTLLNGDVADQVATLKKEEQNFTILGSGKLIRSLMSRNLIDTYVLLIFPLVLGTGLKLFADGALAKLKLVDSMASSTGVIIATYQQV
jgi:dihydrofolate reductase